MAESAPHLPEDDIEAAPQRMAESAPQLPEDDIEAAPQQPVQDENAPADADKSSHSDESPQPTYEQRLYKSVKSRNKNWSLRGYLDFQDLSEMNIVYLMNELAKYDQATKKNMIAPQDIEHVGDLLHRYSKCVYFAMMIVSSLIYLHVSNRGSGPRILVQTPQV